MEYSVFKKLNLKEGDVIGLKFKNGDHNIVMTFKSLNKDNERVRYWIHGMSHNNLLDCKKRLLYVEELKVISRVNPEETELPDLEVDPSEDETEVENRRVPRVSAYRSSAPIWDRPTSEPTNAVNDVRMIRDSDSDWIDVSRRYRGFVDPPVRETVQQDTEQISVNENQGVNLEIHNLEDGTLVTTIDGEVVNVQSADRIPTVNPDTGRPVYVGENIIPDTMTRRVVDDFSGL